MPKPFVRHIEIPREVRRSLHRSQVFLRVIDTPSSSLLSIAIVPAEERILIVPTGEVNAPKVIWINEPKRTQGSGNSGNSASGRVSKRLP